MYKDKIESSQKKLIIYTGQLRLFYKPQQNFCELIFFMFSGMQFHSLIPEYLIQPWSRDDE